MTAPSATSSPSSTGSSAAVTTIQARIAGIGLQEEARELWRYRYLIRVLVARELRVRYKNSVLGIAWSLVNTVLQVLVLTVAVGYILGSGPRNLSAYMLCAYLPWNFFQTSVLDGSSSVVSQLGLLKKIYFPREIPVIAAIGANLIHFAISLGVFVVYRWGLMTLLYGWPGLPPIQVLWLPALIVVQVLLTLGVAFFVATWNVFYEDVKFIVTSLMSFLFYLVPIIYFAENIRYSSRISSLFWRSAAYHLYLGNPLAWLVTAYKQIFFQQVNIANRGGGAITSAPFDVRYFFIALVTSSLICLAGYTHFNAHKWRFTERP